MPPFDRIEEVLRSRCNFLIFSLLILRKFSHILNLYKEECSSKTYRNSPFGSENSILSTVPLILVLSQSTHSYFKVK